MMYSVWFLCVVFIVGVNSQVSNWDDRQGCPDCSKEILKKQGCPDCNDNGQDPKGCPNCQDKWESREKPTRAPKFRTWWD